jgi:hypothetical protein
LNSPYYSADFTQDDIWVSPNVNSYAEIPIFFMNPIAQRLNSTLDSEF